MAKRNQDEDLGLEVVEEPTEFEVQEDEDSASWVLGVPDDDSRLEKIPSGSMDRAEAQDRITPASDALYSEFAGDRPRENPRPEPHVTYERSPRTGTVTAVVQPLE